MSLRLLSFCYHSFDSADDDIADIHALVLFYQLVSLNVAVNSYDNALLTLLVSNQFVEIKGCEYFRRAPWALR